MVSKATDSIRMTSTQGKKETSTNLSKFLKNLNVSFEIVMGYHCFLYKDKHHRVKSVLEAKKSMGLYV